ncbi:MAG: hypothetical protein ISR77_12460 [Pirellulaceae bacterium]|nr:hypothetical protein [Pirellulaceae bacterium]
MKSGRIIRLVITATILLLLGVSLEATEVDFWRPYAGPDQATYLLATFDDEAAPGGSAKVEHTERPNRLRQRSGATSQALGVTAYSCLGHNGHLRGTCCSAASPWWAYQFGMPSLAFEAAVRTASLEVQCGEVAIAAERLARSGGPCQHAALKRCAQ